MMVNQAKEQAFNYFAGHDKELDGGNGSIERP